MMRGSPSGTTLLRFASIALALSFGLLIPTASQAAIVFQAEQPTYFVTSDGATQALVKMYLVQTQGTTTVTSGGGLNSVGVKVTASSPPTNPVRLVSIAKNPAYDGNSTLDTAGGFLYEELQSATAGVPAESTDRWFLGTFTYSGQTAGGQPAATTTFTISTQGGSFQNTFTANGTSLDSSIQSSQFTVVVPEPAGLSLAALLAAGLLARRARRA
jgi:hypothetical protein